MDDLQEIAIAPESVAGFIPLVGEAEVARALGEAQRLRERLRGRTVWNVNSTGAGGGVAELLRSLLAYAQGAGIDARWLVIQGGPEFFRITKRLHNALHGERGDGSPLGEAERAHYRATLRRNAPPLLARLRPGEVVILHDPQPAGLAHLLLARGMEVIWRCHVGTDVQNEESRRGWAFLLPELAGVREQVFSRAVFAPPELAQTATVVSPSIDPFSSKNVEMDETQVREILECTGLIQSARHVDARYPCEGDGERAVTHRADVTRIGPLPAFDVPLVVQVSRWDHLKDPLGVMQGFVRMIEGGESRATLMLAGPSVHAVADDPDSPRVFAEVTAAWRGLPEPTRRRIHLANLPMADVLENAAIVNALQRHATVVVQKSLREGFGLTVTEAMWKARPVLASAIGGICDQIEDGVSGALLRDPTDLSAFARALRNLLDDPHRAEQLGVNAKERVRTHFLGLRHLLQFAKLIERLDAAAGAAGPHALH